MSIDVHLEPGATDHLKLLSAIGKVNTAGGRGEMFLRARDWSLAGGYTLPPYASVIGEGEAATRITHTGTNILFNYADDTTFEKFGRITDLTILGNSGVNSVGVRFNRSQRHRIERCSIWNYTNGFGIDHHVTSGSTPWIEHVYVKDTRVHSCKVGVRYVCLAPAVQGPSFGYSILEDVHLVVGANQIGVQMTGAGAGLANLYNFRWKGEVHLAGNNAIALDVAADAQVGPMADIDVVGELLGSPTGCVRIRNRGYFRAKGQFWLYTPTLGNVADDTTGAPQHVFKGWEVDSAGAPYQT